MEQSELSKLSKTHKLCIDPNTGKQAWYPVDEETVAVLLLERLELICDILQSYKVFTPEDQTEIKSELEQNNQQLMNCISYYDMARIFTEEYDSQFVKVSDLLNTVHLLREKFTGNADIQYMLNPLLETWSSRIDDVEYVVNLD